MLNYISSFVNHGDDNGLFYVLSQIKNKVMLIFCHQQLMEVIGERVFSNFVAANILKSFSQATPVFLEHLHLPCFDDAHWLI